MEPNRWKAMRVGRGVTASAAPVGFRRFSCWPDGRRCLQRIAALICCVFLLGAAQAAGQTPPTPDAAAEKPTRLQGGFGVVGGVPIGDFAVNVEGAGGLLGHLAVGLGESVVTLGGEVAYLWYGEESRKVPLSVTIPEALVTVNTDNAMFLLHGRVRAQPRRGRWRPYVDGVLGFTDIFTKTSVALGDFCGFFIDDPACSLAETTNLRDFVLSYGGGAGVMVGFGSPPHPARLDISVRYLRGGQADYLREGAHPS